MCAPVYSSLLLFTLTIISIFFETKMVTVGLPLIRQEHGADKGILAGEDFLSVFLSSSLRHYPESSTNEPTTTEPETETTYARATRSTSFLTSPPIAQTQDQDSFYDTTMNSAQLQKLELNNNKEQSSDSSLNDGVVVGVRVSSSVGRTLINKQDTGHRFNVEDTTIRETVTEATTIPDQNLVASEEHPSIVAEVNKSEFSVEESEPITTSSDLAAADFLRGYPASVQPLPRPFSASNSDFISQLAQNSDKEKLQPIRQTVIYHNNPREPARARSVSYSTVIQAVPNQQIEKDWEEDSHGRHERHFNGAQNLYENNFHETNKLNNSHHKGEVNWEKPELFPVSSTRRNIFTTERNWEIPEKPYSPSRLPPVYVKSEQNYEVDESASVMTNGRIHGVQPNPTLPPKPDSKIGGDSKKGDDNQKVGYVVEGRNYRKYRVEERTSDGFIVGEYGVVSHNDGSLRGVRYTADGTISPRLIYDALMKFLSL